MLTQEQVRELLNYDPETGVFTWKATTGSRAVAGTVAGSRHSQGYRSIMLFKRNYLAHRLAWLWVYGQFPENTIDHIDRDRTNNAMSNLREATIQENNRNNGAKGYRLFKRTGKWVASIGVDNKNIHLGYFTTPADARAAYLAARATYFGDQR